MTMILCLLLLLLFSIFLLMLISLLLSKGNDDNDNDNDNDLKGSEKIKQSSEILQIDLTLHVVSRLILHFALSS